MFGNLSCVYDELGRNEEALQMRRDVYSGTLELYGEEHRDTLGDSSNYAMSLVDLQRFEEAKAVLRRTVPVARRVMGEGHDLTLKMRKMYGRSLCEDPAATLDDLREAVTTFEEIERIARRVLGSDHPFTVALETSLRSARAALRANETGDMSSVCEALRTAEV